MNVELEAMNSGFVYVYDLTNNYGQIGSMSLSGPANL